MLANKGGPRLGLGLLLVPVVGGCYVGVGVVGVQPAGGGLGGLASPPAHKRFAGAGARATRA